jgi:hypothetical protein
VWGRCHGLCSTKFGRPGRYSKTSTATPIAMGMLSITSASAPGFASRA